MLPSRPEVQKDRVLPYTPFRKKKLLCSKRESTRWYSPRVARWQSPDPLAGNILNPQSLNRYAYVLNNPTTRTDPLGLGDCTKAPDPHACVQQTYYGFAGFPLGELEQVAQTAAVAVCCS